MQICLSIKHIHDRKILHRDIKSQVSREMILEVVCRPILCICDSYVDVAPICVAVGVEPFQKGLISDFTCSREFGTSYLCDAAFSLNHILFVLFRIYF